MITINANLHPIMARMHKPEVDKTTKRPLEVQDKRSVVAIEDYDIDRWLTCSPKEAREMVELIPVHLIDATPAPTVPEVVEAGQQEEVNHRKKAELSPRPMAETDEPRAGLLPS